MDGWVERWVGPWINEWVDGWMGGWLCNFLAADGIARFLVFSIQEYICHRTVSSGYDRSSS
jgi:hypothetical protein